MPSSQERICVNASEWNVLLGGGDLFNRKQKISFAGFIINFGLAPIQRDDARQQTHIAAFYRGPLIAAIYVAKRGSF